MKYSIFIFCIFFVNTILLAQVGLSGRIVDSTQTPIPFAVVALLHSSDSSVVNGVLTDDKGLYVFRTVSPGNYFVKVSAAGFDENLSNEIVADSIHNIVVPGITLQHVKALETITVTAIKPTVEFKGGNITVNVEDSPLAKGNTVYDLLSKLPGVSIENNTITMQGKTGVIVMIDGRVQQMSNEQLLNILKGMSAQNIQRIELLKNPPVKYDAAGTSGMINIVTKKNEQSGFNGNVYTETSQGFYHYASYGVALNYKNGKISVFTGIDGTNNLYQTIASHDRNITTDSGRTAMNSYNLLKDPETGYNFKLGADWYANRRNTFGFNINGGPGTYNSNGTGNNSIVGYNDLGFDHLNSSSATKSKWTILNYNLNAEHLFDTLGTLLGFSTDFTDLKEDDIGFYENHFYDVNENEILLPNIYQNANESGTRIFASKLDFTKHPDSTSTIEAGVKGSFMAATNNYLFERWNPSTNSYYTDTTLSNDYMYDEQTAAAYFNYSKSLKFLILQMGIRAENTTLHGRNTASGFELKDNYFSVFPDLSLEYAKTEKHDFQLNLNRRIDRPAYDVLNPFVIYRDQYSYYQGNPFLKPNFSNTVELTYSFMGIINNSISYSRTNDFMMDHTIQNDSSKIFIEMSNNIKSRNAIAYLLFINYDLTSWWQLTFNGNFTYLEYNGDLSGIPIHAHGIGYNARLSNAFIIPGKTKLETMVLYRGPNFFGTVHAHPRYGISFAITKSFCKEHLDCSIGIDDILYSMKFHSSGDFDNQDWDYYQTQDSRRLKLSISYNFGRVHAEERELNSNEQERERLNH